MAKLPSRLRDKNLRITNEAHEILVKYVSNNPVNKMGLLASDIIVKGVKVLQAEEKK